MYRWDRRIPQSKLEQIMQTIEECIMLFVAVFPFGLSVLSYQNELGEGPVIGLTTVASFAIGCILSVIILLTSHFGMARQIGEIVDKVDRLTPKLDVPYIFSSLDEVISQLDDQNPAQIDAAKQTLRELKNQLSDSLPQETWLNR
jgi:hypothetical protein